MLWFTSDEHYGHKNIIRYCSRPFADVRHMEEHLVQKHNAVVWDEDTVIHLGDFAFLPRHEVQRILERLNGRHFIVRGNHDPTAAVLKEAGFVGLIPNGEAYATFSGFDAAAALEDPDPDIVLSHYPYWRDELAEFDLKYRDRMPRDRGDWLIHGHTHNFHPRVRDRQINVGVDNWDFSPVSFETILEIIRGRLM
jgi:calcineurin-like phosphoesterase family protein